MPSDPMSSADFSRLQRVTPTGLAEDVYQARQKLRQNQPMPIGPSGLAIPRERATYRQTIDGKLLSQIAGKAYAAHCAQALTPEAHARAGEMLADDLRRRFPADDMAVLDRYEFAAPIQTAVVLLLSTQHEQPHHIRLPQPMVLPARAGLYHAALGGPDTSDHPAVPDDVIPYLRRVVMLRHDRQQVSGNITYWPGRFRKEHGRWPRWIEIERAYPVIGAWLQAERAHIKGQVA